MTDTPRARSLAITTTLAVTGLVLAACGGSGGGSSSSSAAPSESPIGGGSAECTPEALTTAATDAATAGFGMLMDGTAVPAGTTMDSYQSSNCADGWALVGANVTPPGGQAMGAVFLFEAEGPMWIPKTVADVCAGTDVPESIRPAACQFLK